MSDVGIWLLWLVDDCLQGWYIVTYALAIYHLNLFLAFLTPKIDPAMSELDGDEGMENSLYSLSFRHFHRLFKINFYERVVSATIFTNSQSKYCLILRCTVTPVEYGNWIEIRLLKNHPRYLILFIDLKLCICHYLRYSMFLVSVCRLEMCRRYLPQCCVFMTFWCGSRSAYPCLWLMDPDPDPAIFVIVLQDATKKLIKKCLCPLLFKVSGTVLHSGSETGFGPGSNIKK